MRSNLLFIVGFGFPRDAEREFFTKHYLYDYGTENPRKTRGNPAETPPEVEVIFLRGNENINPNPENASAAFLAAVSHWGVSLVFGEYYNVDKAR